MRMCLLRDVCFVGDELVYYADPALEGATPPHLSLRAFGTQLTYTGYMQAHFNGKRDGSRYDQTFAPSVVNGPRPPHLRYVDSGAEVFALGVFSMPNNWGHLLLDTILPTIAALDVWGYNHSSLQVVGLDNCSTIHAAQYPLLVGSEVHQDWCERNVERWLVPAFAHPPLLKPRYHDKCFPALIVGHEASMSLMGLFAHRASAIRMLRAVLHTTLRVPEPPLVTHYIVVMAKTTLFNPPAMPQLCELVRNATAGLVQAGGSGEIPVRCEEPSLMSNAEQLTLVSNATLTLAENGSTGYLSMLQRAGTSFVAVLPGIEGERAAEVQTYLYNVDVQAFYWSPKGPDGPLRNTLLVALERAGVRLNLPRVTLVVS